MHVAPVPPSGDLGSVMSWSAICRHILASGLLLCGLFGATGCGNGATETEATVWYRPSSPVQGIDSVQIYYLGLIHKGSTWTAESSPELAALQEAHLANIGRLADLGLMRLAGPLWLPGTESDWRGIFVYRVPSLDSARVLVDTDPAVASQRLAVTVAPWYSSAALDYAENYEMRTYVAAIVRPGDAWNSGPPLTHRQFLDSVNREPRAERIAFYGISPPGESADAPLAFFVFDADSLSAVQPATQERSLWTDPRLDIQWLYWYGPSGLTF